MKKSERPVQIDPLDCQKWKDIPAAIGSKPSTRATPSQNGLAESSHRRFCGYHLSKPFPAHRLPKKLDLDHENHENFFD